MRKHKSFFKFGLLLPWLCACSAGEINTEVKLKIEITIICTSNMSRLRNRALFRELEDRDTRDDSEK